MKELLLKTDQTEQIFSDKSFPVITLLFTYTDRLPHNCNTESVNAYRKNKNDGLSVPFWMEVILVFVFLVDCVS